jgi:hypothetical protein
MSFFGWFKSTPQTPRVQEAFHRAGENSGGGRNPGELKGGALDKADDVAARRKSERARQRDLLFNVVRESMVRVGVLSSSFKFKVLATDPRGRKFIVMMDLSREFGSEISQLAEIEALICQSAKARHNIVVSSVYWRTENAPQAGVKSASDPSVEKYRATVPAASVEVAGPNIPEAPKSKYEPIMADEITAHRRALAAGSAGSVVAVATPPVTRAQNAALLTGFENTEIIDSEMSDREEEIAETEMFDDDAPYPALSPTQYGDLR